MALEFQERTDGYRVCRFEGGVERMLASVQTKALIGHEQNANPPGTGAAIYVPMPRAECTVRSAVGPLTIADLEEIMAGIPGGIKPVKEQAKEVAAKYAAVSNGPVFVSAYTLD